MEEKIPPILSLNWKLAHCPKAEEEVVFLLLTPGSSCHKYSPSVCRPSCHHFLNASSVPVGWGAWRDQVSGGPIPAPEERPVQWGREHRQHPHSAGTATTGH